ncbi:MAG: hydrogenase nickel incorporation protein HypB [Deltaproteobacteria bacterium]|nr:hydrogenase nickel incorporation protein HypB [Deltaproteobacteria bacterium]
MLSCFISSFLLKIPWKKGPFLINIMSSSGSGKASLIIKTIERLRDKYRIAVIEEDAASFFDFGPGLARLHKNRRGLKQLVHVD